MLHLLENGLCESGKIEMVFEIGRVSRSKLLGHNLNARMLGAWPTVRLTGVSRPLGRFETMIEIEIPLCEEDRSKFSPLQRLPGNIVVGALGSVATLVTRNCGLCPYEQEISLRYSSWYCGDVIITLQNRTKKCLNR